MTKSSNDDLRKSLIGLGARSVRKNYYKDLIEKQKALEEKNKILEKEIKRRVDAENELIVLNKELEKRIEERTKALKQSLQHLMEAEKINALSHLVAGISHEINTPIGVALTTASYIEHRIKKHLEQHDILELDDETKKLLVTLEESVDVLLESITISAELVARFKTVAKANEINESINFSVYEYVDMVIKSMAREINKYEHIKFDVNIPQSLSIVASPSIFTSLLTIFIDNSLEHAFEKKGGVITISFVVKEDHYLLLYKDDGVGVDEGIIGDIFTPFFTSNRRKGKAGLGLFSAYNMIQSINGEIVCRNNNGFEIEIKFAKE